MSELLSWLYPAAAVFAGYLVMGITGFGSALVIVPLLAWRWPLAEVVPLVLLLDVPASLLMGRLNLRLVQWSELRQLVPGVLLGGALGLWLFNRAPSAWPLLALGCYVSWIGVRALRQQSVAPSVLRPSPWLGGLYGAAVGAVQVAFGTAGPLVLTWLARRRLPAPAVRASTPMIMTAVGFFVLLLFALEGRLSTALMWQRTLLLFPVGLVGVWAGHAVAGRLDADRLRRIICTLLVLSGCLLVVNALRQLL